MLPTTPPPSTGRTAADYIAALFEPNDHLAIVAVGRIGPEPEVLQRITSAEAAAQPKYQRWLRHLNAKGHDIFVSMNPLKPERRQREKADVAAVRRLQLDLDKSGPQSLREVLTDVSTGYLPAPAAVVRSSKRNYQVIWHAAPDAWTPAQAEDTMRRLAHRYNGDSSVADVARVMRLPGFNNRKPNRENAPVVWTPHAGEPTRPDAFTRLPPTPDLPAAARDQPPSDKPHTVSQSERDWAYAKDQLRSGTPLETVINTLEKRRPDKHNPRQYATRTAEKARDQLRRPQARATPAR